MAFSTFSLIRSNINGRFALTTEISPSTYQIRTRVYDRTERYKLIHEEITSGVSEDYLRGKL